MNKLITIISAIALILVGYSCQSKKAQSSTGTEVQEPKIYKDGFELLFVGTGHGPEWNVRVTENQIEYTNANFPETMVFKLNKTTQIMDVPGVSYIGKNEKGEQVVVQVLKERCDDSMADIQSPFSVDVTVANIPNLGLRGCGAFVEDERLSWKWYVETIKGKEIPKEAVATRPYLKFDVRKNHLNANMGCNGVGGGYELMADRISFNKAFMSTQMFCDGIMELEREFNTIVQGNTLVYSFKGRTLIFKDMNGVVMMTLRTK